MTEEYIDQFWKNEIIQANFELLKEWIALPSIFAQNKGLKEMASQLGDVFRQAGAEVIVDETYQAPLVMAKFASPLPDAKTIIFYNHYDTVPADADQVWTDNPFALTVRDNYIYGRGVDDDKGHISARLSAVQMVLTDIEQLPVNIIFLMEGAEESASVDLEHYLAKHKEFLTPADLLVWEQGNRNIKGELELSGGNKGIVTFDLKVTSANTDIHSSFGGVIESASWYLLQAIQSMRSAKGEILVDGIAERVKQPTQRELDLIDQYALVNASAIKELYGLTLPLLKEERQSLLRNYYFEPAINIQGITTGYQGQGVKTILPAQATAKMEMRLVPGLDPREVLSLIEQHLKDNGFDHIEVVYTLGEASYRSEMSHPSILNVIELAKAAYPEGVAVLPTSAGTGPMHTVHDILEVPIVAFGLGNPNSSDHAGDENVAIEDYYRHIKLIEELIRSYE